METVNDYGITACFICMYIMYRCLYPLYVCQGVKLLSYLYREALDSAGSEHYPMLLSILNTAARPYLM